MEVATTVEPHEHPLSLDAPPAVERDMTIPISPTRASGTKSTASKRHTKGLSLNFPILLPTNPQISQSPIGSGIPSPLDSARSSPRARTAPFRLPDPSSGPHDRSKAGGSGDFLTLLAAQERKVFELKEELQKAEGDLQVLKKQWAAHEANKKRDELKKVTKLQPMALDDAGGNDSAATEEDVDDERRRKRALVERGGANQAATAGHGVTGLSRKGSKRVFQGGRHTRTLSLLSPTSTKPITRTMENMMSIPSEAPGAEFDDDRQPSPSRTTLDGLISGDALPLAFGKTYKDLATHRRSLPPVAADMLVKQGKQVYDGVKDGLWTFFEDIRQATVGEEGISGTVAHQRPVRQIPRKGSRKASDRAGKSSTKTSMESASPGPKEPSFWNEFGLDTPQRKVAATTKAVEQTNGHIQQKSSTDSSNPPSLLQDLNDNDEIEDSWDTWESPKSNKISNVASKTETNSPTNGGLPWPDIQRMSPKLTRTISDLMKEWDTSKPGAEDGNGVRDGQHILDSPHI